MKSQDVRFLTTHKALMEQFKNMMCEMEFTDITVTELTRRTGINRKTFYLHYTCLEKLLTELQDEFVHGILGSHSELSGQNGLPDLIQKVYLYLSSQPTLTAKLMTGKNYWLLTNRIGAQLVEKSISSTPYEPDFYDELKIVHYFNAVELYRHWLRRERPITLEDMTTYAVNLLCTGASTSQKEC
jgi:AcrR family transcriptional regulator